MLPHIFSSRSWGIEVSWFFLRPGMLKAVQLCLQLKEDALCTAGIPCCSFVFLNSGTAQRTPEAPLGREDLEYIQKANTIAARTCLLWLLCTVRYVYFFIEQPQSSRLFIFPYLVHVVNQLRRFMGVYKSFLYLCCFRGWATNGFNHIKIMMR